MRSLWLTMPARTEWTVLELAVVAVVTIHTEALPRCAIFVAFYAAQQVFSLSNGVSAYVYPQKTQETSQ